MIFYPYQYNIQDQDVTGLIRLVESVPAHAMILLWSLEFIPHKRLLRMVAAVENSPHRDRVLWMLQSTFGYHQTLKEYSSDRLYFVEQDLWICHLHQTVWKVLEYSQQWNPDSGKFLFLTGDPDRINRLPLLWRLDQAGLLDRCVWSLFVDEENIEQYHHWFPDQPKHVITEWLHRHNRSADGNRTQSDRSRQYVGSCDVFDVSLFRDTSFRIISETGSSHPFLTEKTWITMLNHQPFLMAAQSAGTLDLMESMGFRTFREYLRYPDYDSESDTIRRMEMIVENVRALLSHLPRNMEADIKHNYQLTQTVMQDTVDKITEIRTRLDTEVPLTRLVPIYRERRRWMMFYYGIKADHWPDCDNEQEFQFLPKEIQQECIEVFGYEPPKVDFVSTKS